MTLWTWKSDNLTLIHLKSEFAFYLSISHLPESDLGAAFSCMSGQILCACYRKTQMKRFL